MRIHLITLLKIMIALAGCSNSIELPKDLTIEHKDRNAWYQKIKWSQECEKDYQDANAGETSSSQVIEIMPYEKDLYLFRVPCLLGAYQTSQAFSLVNIKTKESKTITFPNIWKRDNGELVIDYTEILGGLDEFNNKTKELRTFVKWRGLGDCGSILRYSIDKQGYAKIIEIMQQDCDNTFDQNKLFDGDWPLIIKKYKESDN